MTNEMFRMRRWLRFLAVVLFSVMLAACGSEDADEDPTATSAPSDAQPTVAAEGTAVSSPGLPDGTSVPENTDMSSIESDATAASASPQATPAVSPVPGEIMMRATPGASTPVAGSGVGDPIPGDSEVGDGTTGAVVPGTPVADVAAASPVASPATPATAASPVAALLVTGCEVAEVPPFAGETTTYSVSADLNFRTGPGPDCDLALPDPIGAFQVVDVIRGPVIREDDGSEWVQIEVLGTEGWVVFEFLEPVDE